MPNLATRKTLWLHFLKTQLYSGVTISFFLPYLGYITWPSFDEGYRYCSTGFVENLGHADFLANQPFQHLNFLLTCSKIRDCQPGLGCIIPVHAAVNQPAEDGSLGRPRSMTVLTSSIYLSRLPGADPSFEGQRQDYSISRSLFRYPHPQGGSTASAYRSSLNLAPEHRSSRLWVRISKCSCESLSMKVERRIVNLSILVGKGTGPTTRAPVRSAVSTIRLADWSRTR